VTNPLSSLESESGVNTAGSTSIDETASITSTGSSNDQRTIASKVAASAQNWQRKLLDLTNRNRALNFKPTKVSTVAIVDEQPAVVFKILYLDEKAMKFKAAPEEQPSPVQSATSSSGENTKEAVSEPGSILDVEEGDETHIGMDFAPYDATTLGEQHTDDWLQTASQPEALDKSLRRLDEQARASIEEQGVNTLFLALGMLYYKESAASDIVLKAPIVLLPVELSRKSVRSGYTIKAADDEPMVNPALAQLLRQQYGISLPPLPDLQAIPDDYDLQQLLTVVQQTIGSKAGWSLKTDIYLGLFSFQKLVMYKDLEANIEALKAHRLIRQLITRKGLPISALPKEIRDMQLDREYPPEAGGQVVDADSSQLRAIVAAGRNMDLVIEGPPGTGKSQTITNLIAQALAANKSVLFVAEKMAALSVVYERLRAAGLSEFCLELHSTKTNKRAVMQELGVTLNKSLTTIAAPASARQRLPVVRTELTEYSDAVHTPFGTLGITPYRAYGELGRVLKSVSVEYSGPVDAVSHEQLDDAVRSLADLSAAAAGIGVPNQHPWRDATKKFYSPADLETIERLSRDSIKLIGDLEGQAAVVTSRFYLGAIDNFHAIETAARFGDVVQRSPGVASEVLRSASWNRPPAAATSLIEHGRQLRQLRERAFKTIQPLAADDDHRSDVAYMESKFSGTFSFLRIFDSRYRSIANRWKTYRQPGYSGSMLDQIPEMRHLQKYQESTESLRESSDTGRDLFGELWRGEESDWSALEEYVKWVVEFRSLYLQQNLPENALDVATSRAPDISIIANLKGASSRANETLTNLTRAVGWPEGYLGTLSFRAIVNRMHTLVDAIGEGPGYAAFEEARSRSAVTIVGELIPLAMSGRMKFTELGSAFLRAFYMRWLTTVVAERPALLRFHTVNHEQRIAEFQRLDKAILAENQASLIGQMRDKVQTSVQNDSALAQMPYLQREIAKQRAHAPLRRTMQLAGDAIMAIKPCLMMSPLTVAQLLDGSKPKFDMIVFDEASQLPGEDAVGAIIRGKQLVVVGDPKQLPPTNFFSVSTGTANTELDEDGLPMVQDAESILEEYMGAGIPMSRLKWHYRSAHESLIRFSNVEFYESDLYTFPSIDTGNSSHGLQFELVEGGVYEGKGLNMVEARRVVDEVVDFAREQLAKQGAGDAPLSLGVGTFNMRQQLAIQDELEVRRRNDSSIDAFFDRGRSEPFFVKNLENIQGDERDVIFISVTYAKAPDGRLRYNFGPINGENGWRRLNVLTTRARQRMKVFSSMRGDEISAAGTTSRGASLLREFLRFAESGVLDSTSANATADTESPFESEVLQELTIRGYRVTPQVGSAGYRIDFGVHDDELPGRFICGIECDGVAYHSCETARDRDRLRQEVLEVRGWTIHRVWSTDWFKDRAGQIERLVRLIEQSRAQATQEAEAERIARQRLQAEEQAERRAREEEARKQVEADAQMDVKPYVRPVAAPYVHAGGEGQYEGSDILIASDSQVTQIIRNIVDVEGPIHEVDLFARVAAVWGTRAGTRIQSRLRGVLRLAEQNGLLQRRGPFLWNSNGTCVVRTRAGSRIPADRICAEEYQTAVLQVLADGHGFSREQLLNEVRSVFGYSRTGPALEEAIGAAIEALLAARKIGEGATGIRKRF
jgi:very-short-patch-repair endonuclease